VLSQKGTVYKQKEIETLLAAIDEFVAKTGLKVEEPPEPTAAELEAFRRLLE
jgi:hypothetical protein